jgi:hypothetical protein
VRQVDDRANRGADVTGVNLVGLILVDRLI